MQLKEPTDVKTDVLIIGGGGAGLRAAIEARKAQVKVLIVAKSRVGQACNTSISNGGFAAATGWRDAEDNPQVYLRDTITGGNFVNDQSLVEVIAQGSAQQIEDLAGFGVAFLKKEGRIQLSISPGHSYHRTVRGEHSFGQDFTVPLRKHALKMGVALVEGVLITHLLARDKVVVGAVGVNREGESLIFQAKAVILATGGAGQVYLNTDNAGPITGDGYALAYQLELSLRDMEFVQFYPTALGPLGRTVIEYESLVFRFGATLRNSLGEDILQRHGLKDPLLMTRDRLSRALFREISEGRGEKGGVVMDLTTIPPESMGKARGAIHFPFPAGTERFIVVPTCHFFMGGVTINEHGETERKGLWAAGEVCAGAHGANRLAGNAITEIFVFGAITGKEAAAWATKTTSVKAEPRYLNEALDYLKSLVFSQGRETERELREEMKKTMWLHAGIIREQKGLKESLRKLSSLYQALPLARIEQPRHLFRVIELRNMLLTSQMICHASLMRQESRGSHFRSDFPQENNQDWLKNIFITRRGQEMELSAQPVKFGKVPYPTSGTRQA